MPLLAQNQTCQACRKRGPCWLVLEDKPFIFCAGCWDPERFGPLPEVRDAA